MHSDPEGSRTALPTGVRSWLDIDLAEHDAAAVVLLAGDLDLDSAPRLRAALSGLVGRGDRDVVIDVSELHFCGAVGLGILIATAQDLPPGSVLRVVGATGMLRRLLRVTGVDEVVRVEPAAISR